MINKKYLSDGELLYYISLSLYLFANMVRSTFFAPLVMGRKYDLLILLAVLIVALKELISASPKIRTIILLFLTVGLMLLMQPGSSGFINRQASLVFIYIYSARNIELKKLMSFIKWITISFLTLIIFSSQIGIIEDYVSEGRVRHYLGFRYALYPSMLLLNVAMIQLLESNKNINWPMWVLILVSNWWIYYMSDSNTSYYMTIACFVLAVALKIKLINDKRILYLLIFSFVLFAVISIAVTYNYNPKIAWQSNLNKILGNRLKLGKASLKEYGVSLLGEKITWSGNGLSAFGEYTTEEYNFVDCLYIRVVQRYGIIFFSLVMILLTKAMHITYKKKYFQLLFACAIVALHCVTDDLSLFLYYNFMWIPLGLTLYYDFVKEKNNQLDAILGNDV